jgi:hypothetical protein
MRHRPLNAIVAVAVFSAMITLPGIAAGFAFSLSAEKGWVASLIGSLIGVVVIASRRRGMKYALPFGTFLALGAAAAGAVGAALLEWQLSQ